MLFDTSPTCVPEEVWIGALFPQFHTAASGYTIDSSGIIRFASFLLALNEINNKTDGVADDLLPNTQLKYKLRDSKRNELASMTAAFDFAGSCSNVEDNAVTAVVGAASSDPSIVAQEVLKHSSVVQISYSSTSPQLSDGVTFPYFLRTVAFK